jgi:hypothetical protein
MLSGKQTKEPLRQVFAFRHLRFSSHILRFYRSQVHESPRGQASVDPNSKSEGQLPSSHSWTVE